MNHIHQKLSLAPYYGFWNSVFKLTRNAICTGLNINQEKVCNTETLITEYVISSELNFVAFRVLWRN